ncbi:MAG: hypothetical protein HXY35_11980 [Chloroflexi bacterium]|nr:hypothetical protein [Chloroflexota bacterium]
MNNKFSQQGQALILTTLAMIGLVAFGALAIDGGRVLEDRRHAQNAADTAAFAAALANAEGEDLTTAAQTRAATNGYDGGDANDVIITFTNTQSGACPSTGKDITVTIISDVPTTFARVIGRNLVENVVVAKVRSCDYYTKGGAPLYSGAAVFATKTEPCGGGLNNKALFVQGSSHLQVWGGDLATASTDGNCIYFKGGEAQLKKAESGTACADIITAAPSGGTCYNKFQQFSLKRETCVQHVPRFVIATNNI